MNMSGNDMFAVPPFVCGKVNKELAD